MLETSAIAIYRDAGKILCFGGLLHGYRQDEFLKAAETLS
jgi:hypothetical protein